MYELRVLTMSGRVFAFAAPQLRMLRRQLTLFTDNFAIRGYAFRDKTGWCESGGDKLPADQQPLATLIWQMPE